MKLSTINDIFHVTYPSTLVLSKLDLDDTGINFVSSSGKNNGVSAQVKRCKDKKIYSKGSITVPLKGSVLVAFLQEHDFHCAHQIAVLTAKIKLTRIEKLLYCSFIRANRYRYNYGRQADKTLKNIKVPHYDEVKEIAKTIKLPNQPVSKAFQVKKINLDDRDWDWFVYEDLFEIKKGKRLTKADMEVGLTPFIGAIDHNNGLSNHISLPAIFKENTITINYDGNGVAESYYQPKPFWALDSVNVLYPKFNLNPYIAMFIITITQTEKYRFNYGRKWHKARMEESKIKLPIDQSGNPDWQFMEDYIKSLPYSANLAI